MIFNKSKVSGSATRTQRGAAIIELAITAFVVLLIVLGTVHVGVVIREASVIIEAARHGARSAVASSGNDALDLVNIVTVGNNYGPLPCNGTLASPAALPSSASSNPVVGTAVVATCQYLSASGLDVDGWNVEVHIVNLPDQGGYGPWAISVSVAALPSPNPPRGPVKGYPIAWLNMRPAVAAIFPLEML